MSVKFNKSYLDLIKELTPINKSIIIDKDGDNIVISRTNPSTTIAYKLTTAKDNFDFDGENIAFYNYLEFHQLISIYDNPELNQSGNKITISEKNSKITYCISDAETLTPGPKKIDFTNPDCSVVLKVDDIKEIENMIDLINFGRQSENINLEIKDDKITIKVYNEGYENSFEKSYALESKSAKNFSFNISAETFILIPKKDYKLEIKNEGIVKFSIIDKVFNLDIYTAEVEKN